MTGRGRRDGVGMVVEVQRVRNLKGTRWSGSRWWRGPDGRVEAFRKRF